MERYNLVRKRRMKNLRLRVKEDGKVYVSAPYGVSVSIIDDFVANHSQWITEQRKKLETVIHEPQKNSVSDGDIITLFGEKYSIFAFKGTGKAYIHEKTLKIPVPDISDEKEISAKVIEFMTECCKKLCTEATETYLKKSGYKDGTITIRFKYLKSKWGSYNKQKNVITFNIMLVKLPVRFINYVVAHEVAHIFVQNHSDDFYRFGETIYDGFFTTDRQLNKIKIKGIFS